MKRLCYFIICCSISLILQLIKATDNFTVGGIFGVLMIIVRNELFIKKGEI